MTATPPGCSGAVDLPGPKVATSMPVCPAVPAGWHVQSDKAGNAIVCTSVRPERRATVAVAAVGRPPLVPVLDDDGRIRGLSRLCRYAPLPLARPPSLPPMWLVWLVLAAGMLLVGLAIQVLAACAAS